MRGRSRSALLAALLWAVGSAAAAGAAEPPDEYRIGPEDVLAISVWVHPELDRTVTVTLRGTIVFPPLGEIQVSEVSPRQLSERLSERLSTYLRQSASVTVTVTQYVSRNVLVAGAVASPGRYGFERIPGVLDVLSRAGGALPGADLSRVQVLRRDGEALRAAPADLARALAEGTAEGLPELRPGDILMVPAARAPGEVSPDAVGVLGQVRNPGVYHVGEGLDLWMLLAQAGGPTDNGDLAGVKVLSRDREPRSAVSVNLLENLKSGRRTAHMIRPGDIVYLNPKGVSLWSGFTQVLAFTRDVLNVVLLAQVLKER